MTHSILTSSLSCQNRHYGKHYYRNNLYQVVINTEDGDVYEYEVEADSFSDASRQAENLAMDLMADITYIECYSM